MARRPPFAVVLLILLIGALSACQVGERPPAGTSGTENPPSVAGTGEAGSDEGGEDEGGAAAGSQAPQAPIPTVIVLDASGSMRAQDAPGQRFAAAREAVAALVEEFPAGQQLGLVSYGSGTGNTAGEQEEGCRDVTTDIPVGDLDADQFLETVEAIEPSGYTPIARALETAVDELPDSGPRAVILLSDGIDTCSESGGQDPVDRAEDLAADEDLVIHTVGLRVDAAASGQLDAIAAATGGTSWDAVNDQQLSSRLAALIDPARREGTLTPEGIGGLRLGMSAQEATAVAGWDEAIADTGTIEVEWQDCTLTFVDGVLEEIATRTVTTLDGVGVGDPLSRAEEVWGDPLLPTRIEDDGSAIYMADPFLGTAYRVFTEDTLEPGAQEDPSGTIARIVLCRCGTATSFQVSPPPWFQIPGCTPDSCVVPEAVVVQRPGAGAVTLAVVLSDDREGGTVAGSVVAIDAAGETTVVADGFQIEGEASYYAEPESWDFFLTPATDLSGAVFLDIPNYRAPQLVRIAVDAEGAAEVLLGADLVSRYGLGSGLGFTGTSVGEIDENGYFTIVVEDLSGNPEAETTVLAWDGEEYRPRG